MTSRELERLHELALRIALAAETFAIAAVACARQAAELADELEALSDNAYADEQERPLLVVRKGTR